MQLGSRRWLASLALLVLVLALPGRAQQAGARATLPLPEDLVRADTLINQGKLEPAIALLNDLAKVAPKIRGVEARLGKAYYSKPDYPAAAAHLEAALREDPNDLESTQILGLAYYLMGQLPKALPLLEKIQSSIDHPDVTGSYILGITYLQSHQYDKARAAFAKMFSVAADSPNAHLVLGQMMLRQEFDEQAIPELKKALELDPRLPMAHFLLGEIYLFRSNTEGALAEFRQELEFNPILWLVYWRLGDAYTRLEKWREAEQALKQAIWLNQNFTGPFILMGKVQLKKGSPDLAAGFLERALKMDPNNYLAHYLLGQAYQQLGRADDAKREFEATRALREVKEP
jgi:tetratricopeptide (TPR) repeat protein